MLLSSKFQIPLLVLLQLVCLWGGGTADTVRHVNWNTGHDNSTCWEGSIPCATLAYALEDLDSDTAVVLDDEEITYLNNTTVQGPISNITINSSHGNTVIVCFEQGAFAFFEVSRLTITNVEFRGCGALHNSTSYDRLGWSTPYMMSVYLYNCTNVSLLSTNVSYSPGAGVVMLSVRGHVNVMNSTFLNNGFRISRNGSYINNETVLIGRLAGGGLKIELPSCPPGMNSVDCNGNSDVCPSEGSSLPEYTDVAYNIENCSFISNTADVPNFNAHEYDDPETGYFTTIGRGGGVSIVVKGVSRKIQVAVTNCQFEYNWSLYGAGLFMELWHRPDNVSMNITSSNFMHNLVPYNSMWDVGTGGGGFMYFQRYCQQHPHEGNSLLVSDCNFIGNKAYWGGGVSLVLLPQQRSQTGDMVMFQSSSFVGNVARIGAAIDFFPRSKGILPQAVLQDMQFENNDVNYGDEQSYINGEGIVYVDSTILYVKSSLHIVSNQGNGISSLYSTIHFFDNSTSLFYDNQAYRGAALALYGNAAIVLHNGSHLNFTQNRVDTVGGAIYHTAPGNRALFNNYGACPIQMAPGLNWSNTDLWFINNTAAQGGRGMSIYTYSMYPCVERSFVELNETFHWSAFHYMCDNVSNPNCIALQVSGDGRFVKHIGTANLSINAFPSEQAPLPFTVEDELHNEVKVHYEGVVQHNGSIYAVDVLNGSEVIITGKFWSNAMLELHSTESQTLSVLVNLTITDCPPGFVLQGNSEGMWTCKCASNALTTTGLICHPENMASYLRHDNWVGYLMANDSNASVGCQTGYCPPGFCREQSIILKGSDHYNSHSLDVKVCGPQNRTGVLCGKCQEGYGLSMLLNEPFQCAPCNSSSIAKSFKVVVIWFFTEFVPLNILLIFFIVFNVNILSGWGGALYGLVFYFQIVTSTPPFQYQAPSSVDETPPGNWYDMSLYINEVLSNFWNLMFLSAFVPNDACMAKQATVQDAILVNYLLILVWPLVVYSCLIAIHRCYRHGYCCRSAHICLFKFGRKLAKCQQSEGGVNSLAGLCSFFILAYTRLAILTGEIAGHSTVTSSNGFEEVTYVTVFLYNGTVDYFHPTLHAPYVVSILLCSIVSVFIPTLLLVSFPLVPKLLVKLKLHERRPFCWIISLLSTSYLTFLFDIFQGCFRPNTRYFAALYLIYRHLFIIVWFYSGPSIVPYSIFQIILGVVFIMLHLVAQPFASNAVNRITGLVMTNLTLVIVLTQGMIVLDQELELSGNYLPIQIITIVLLYLPHLAVAILFIWVIGRYTYRRVTQRGCAHRLSSPPHNELEESGCHSNTDDWDAVRYRCNSITADWEGSHGNREGVHTGYVQLEEEPDIEEEEEEESLRDREDTDGLMEQLHIQGLRHTTSSGRKMHSGYGSLADYRKT